MWKFKILQRRAFFYNGTAQKPVFCIKSLFYTETGRFWYQNDCTKILNNLTFSEKWFFNVFRFRWRTAFNKIFASAFFYNGPLLVLHMSDIKWLRFKSNPNSHPNPNLHSNPRLNKFIEFWQRMFLWLVWKYRIQSTMRFCLQITDLNLIRPWKYFKYIQMYHHVNDNISQNAFMQCTANVESLSFFDDF